MRVLVQYLRDTAADLRARAAELDRQADIIEHQPPYSKQHERRLARQRWLSLSPTERYQAAYTAAGRHPIVQAVTQYFRVEVEALCSKRRTDHLAHIRHIAMYLLYKSGLSTTEVGELLNRDHSTVIAGNNVIARRMEMPAFRQEINKILDMLAAQENRAEPHDDEARTGTVSELNA